MHRTLAPERLAALVGPIDRDPAYRGLCQALQALIGDGRIPIGTRLPSERAVSRALGVSRNTVTRAYADLAGSGIQVNALAPGYFATELTRALVDDPEFSAWVAKRTPAGRWGETRELVGTLLFLASPASDFVNGQVIFVDGGMTAVV